MLPKIISGNQLKEFFRYTSENGTTYLGEVSVPKVTVNSVTYYKCPTAYEAYTKYHKKINNYIPSSDDSWLISEDDVITSAIHKVTLNYNDKKTVISFKEGSTQTGSGSGTQTIQNPVKQECIQPSSQITAPTKSGYEFLGYTTTDGTLYITHDLKWNYPTITNITSDINLIAKWGQIISEFSPSSDSWGVISNGYSLTNSNYQSISLFGPSDFFNANDADKKNLILRWFGMYQNNCELFQGVLSFQDIIYNSNHLSSSFSVSIKGFGVLNPNRTYWIFLTGNTSLRSGQLIINITYASVYSFQIYGVCRSDSYIQNINPNSDSLYYKMFVNGSTSGGHGYTFKALPKGPVLDSSGNTKNLVQVGTYETAKGPILGTPFDPYHNRVIITGTGNPIDSGKYFNLLAIVNYSNPYFTLIPYPHNSNRVNGNNGWFQNSSRPPSMYAPGQISYNTSTVYTGLSPSPWWVDIQTNYLAVNNLFIVGIFTGTNLVTSSSSANTQLLNTSLTGLVMFKDYE